MTVDVCGVVTAVGAAGTVKRKSDQAELQRRDMTLVDQRCAGEGARHAPEQQKRNGPD